MATEMIGVRRDVATMTVTTFWLETSEPDRIKDDAKNAAFTFEWGVG